MFYYFPEYDTALEAIPHKYEDGWFSISWLNSDGDVVGNTKYPKHFLSKSDSFYGNHETFEKFAELKQAHSNFKTPSSAKPKYVISKEDWHIDLADTIHECEDDSVIFVHNPTMLQLAKSAQKRLCPNKKITFVVKDQ